MTPTLGELLLGALCLFMFYWYIQIGRAFWRDHKWAKAFNNWDSYSVKTQNHLSVGHRLWTFDRRL